MTLNLFGEDTGAITPAAGSSIRAISLWQPWATLIGLGLKTYETRGWDGKYSGWVAVHAAKKWSKEQAEFVDNICREGLLEREAASTMPRGGFVAIARIVQCIPTENVCPDQRTADELERTGRRPTCVIPLDAPERRFGDYRAWRYAWQLADIMPISFTPARGQQGFWNEALTTFRDHKTRIILPTGDRLLIDTTGQIALPPPSTP